MKSQESLSKDGKWFPRKKAKSEIGFTNAASVRQFVADTQVL
jgi:hypothetical protein